MEEKQGSAETWALLEVLAWNSITERERREKAVGEHSGPPLVQGTDKKRLRGRDHEILQPDFTVGPRRCRLGVQDVVA